VPWRRGDPFVGLIGRATVRLVKPDGGGSQQDHPVEHATGAGWDEVYGVLRGRTVRFLLRPSLVRLTTVSPRAGLATDGEFLAVALSRLRRDGTDDAQYDWRVRAYGPRLPSLIVGLERRVVQRALLCRDHGAQVQAITAHVMSREFATRGGPGDAQLTVAHGEGELIWVLCRDGHIQDAGSGHYDAHAPSSLAIERDRTALGFGLREDQIRTVSDEGPELFRVTTTGPLDWSRSDRRAGLLRLATASISALLLVGSASLYVQAAHERNRIAEVSAAQDARRSATEAEATAARERADAQAKRAAAIDDALAGRRYPWVSSLDFVEGLSGPGLIVDFVTIDARSRKAIIKVFDADQPGRPAKPPPTGPRNGLEVRLLSQERVEGGVVWVLEATVPGVELRR